MKRYYFDNDDAKHDAFQKLRKLLPTVKSCYQPSGRRSPETMRLLSAGVLLGALISSIVGFVVLLITSLCVKLLGHIPIETRYVQAVSGVISLLVTYSALGAVAALMLGPFSRRGRNRDPSTAAWMAVATVIIGVLLLGTCARLIVGYWSAPTEESFLAARAGAVRAALGPFDIYWRGLFPFVSLVSGTSMAALVAACMAASAVGKHKFCEKCDVPMSKPLRSYLVPLSIDGASRLVEVLDKRPRDPVGLFKTLDRYDGRDCDTQLFVCPSCGIGILEATVHFASGQVKMQGGRPIEYKETVDWLAASEWLSPSEVDLLRPFRSNSGLSYPLPIKVKFDPFGDYVHIKLPE